MSSPSTMIELFAAEALPHQTESSDVFGIPTGLSLSQPADEMTSAIRQERLTFPYACMPVISIMLTCYCLFITGTHKRKQFLLLF